jgi:hypothetical protein
VSNQFRNMLEAQDLSGLRSAWALLAPHLPQPKNRAVAEIVMHRARTEAESLSIKHRAYSHRWLVERSLPSGLPDALKQSAERLYPVITQGVGISVKFRNKYMKGAELEVRTSMEDAVNDAYASVKENSFPDPAIVKQQMEQARERTMRVLFG